MMLRGLVTLSTLREDWFFPKLLIFLLLGVMAISWKTWKLSPPLALYYFYSASCSALICFMVDFNKANAIETAIRSDSFVWTGVFTIFIFLFNLMDLSKLKKGMGILYYVACLVTIGYVYGGGIHSNTSINGVLIAVLFPFVFYLHRKPFDRFLSLPIFMGIFALHLSGGAAGNLGFYLSICAYYFFKPEWKKVQLPLATFSAIGAWVFAICVWYFPVASKFIDGSGRESIWEHAYRTVIHNKAWIMGFGYGTYSFFGPRIEVIATQFQNPYGIPFAAHNDFFQSFFEGGVIGFALFVSLQGWCLWKAIKMGGWVIPFAVNWIVCSYAYFPNHMMIEMLCFFIFLQEICKSKDRPLLALLNWSKRVWLGAKIWVSFFTNKSYYKFIGGH